MKIEILKDFRTLKKGDVYDFTILKDFSTLVLVGENGCGKSSLIHAVRGTLNSMPTESLYEYDFKKLSQYVKIEHEYEKIFYYDNIKDNGSDLMVGYDAVNFLNSGGMYAQKKSHGEGSLMYIAMFLEKLEKNYVPGKTLVVFDEADNGFSIKHMVLFNNLIENLMRKNMHVLIISHNPFLMSKQIIVFNFSENDINTSTEYIFKETGFNLIRPEV